MVDKTTKVIVGIVVILVVIMFGMIVFQGEPSTTGSVVGTSGDVIKIGVIMPLTEAAADIGKSNVRAFEVAVDEINDEGGIDGKQIEVIIEDSKGCDSKTAVSAMQKLINVDKVPIVYSLCSGVALATHPIAESNKVVHFGCASNPDVTHAGDYMFRIVPADDFAGEVAANYVQDEFNAQKVAILHCDNDWCVGLKDSFKENFLKLGGQIVAEEQIKTDTTDARAELTKIKASNPDLVYFTGYPGETVVVFKQSKELGLTMPFFGGDAWLDQSIADEAGDTANNKYFTTPAKAYTKEFERKVDGDIAICAPESYDLVYVLAQTIEKSGTNPTDIKNELYKLRNFRGESGTFGIDSNGDLLGGALDIKAFMSGKIIDYELKVA